jgi:RNA polymerase sigma-70 factor, ECF subfamily
MALPCGDGLNPSKLAGRPEAVLVRQAQAGDEAAFEELMHRSWDRCFRLALSILGNSDDAKDETQNAFWKAYLHVVDFAGESKFSTWVGRIVTNNCMMRIRSRRRARTISYDKIPGAPESFQLPDDRGAVNPEHRLANQEVMDRLRVELRRVPKILRIPLELRHLQELPLKQVAARLGVSVGATKSRLTRGHSYLRDRMKIHVNGYGKTGGWPQNDPSTWVKTASHRGAVLCR